MTKLLDQALEVARSLPSDAQDDIARVVLQLAGVDDAPPVALSTDERGSNCSIKGCRGSRRIRNRRASSGDLGQTRAVKLRYTLPALADLSSILD